MANGDGQVKKHVREAVQNVPVRRFAVVPQGSDGGSQQQPGTPDYNSSSKPAANAAAEAMRAKARAVKERYMKRMMWDAAGNIARRLPLEKAHEVAGRILGGGRPVAKQPRQRKPEATLVKPRSKERGLARAAEKKARWRERRGAE